QFSRLAEAEPAAAEATGQRLPLDELLDQIAGAVFGLPALVEGDDAGVLQLGRAARLAHEAIQVFLAGEAAGPKHLAGHRAGPPGVACPEDVSERAGAEFLEQLELAESAPPRGGRGTDRTVPRGRERGREQVLWDRFNARRFLARRLP